MPTALYSDLIGNYSATSVGHHSFHLVMSFIKVRLDFLLSSPYITGNGKSEYSTCKEMLVTWSSGRRCGGFAPNQIPSSYRNFLGEPKFAWYSVWITLLRRISTDYWTTFAT